MTQRNLDINLLKVLVALLQEKNTSKAAEILDTSQPSVSRALAKLREELDDPLFYRDKQGLKLSPKAEVLAETLPRAYQALLDTFEESVFQPQNYNGKLRIAMNAYIADIFGSKLYQHIKQQMPNVTIEILSWNESTCSQILDEQIDIAISFLPMELPKGIYEKPISSLKFGVIVNPTTFGSLESFDFLQAIHQHPICTVLIPAYNNQRLRFEKTLNLKLDSLNILLRSHFIPPIIELVKQSDAMFVAPKKLFDRLNDPQLQFIDLNTLPDDITSAQVGIIYNAKNRTSPIYQWLDQQITQCVQSDN